MIESKKGRKNSAKKDINFNSKKTNPMKTLKIKDHTIRCIERKGKSNYELSVTIMKKGIFTSGGILKTESSDAEIKKFAKELIQIGKKPVSLF